MLTNPRRPIAVIKPIKEASAPEAVLKRMVDERLITLPTSKWRLPRCEPVALSGEPLSQTIIGDRDDRA